MAVALMDPTNEPWVASSQHRSGGISIKRMLTRDSGVGGFELSISEFADKDFYASRHTHAFDQIRFALEGATKYGSLTLKPGIIGYFPAGTSYGPQTVEKPSVFTTLQFDGSGDGFFCSTKLLDETTPKMAEKGRFEKGVFTTKDGQQIEAWQATFEAATGRKPIIPPARYPDPIFMRMESFPWRAQPGSKVLKRTLGVFGQPPMRLGMLQIPKGEAATLGEQGHPIVAFIYDGAVDVQGKSYGKWTGLLVEETDTARVTGVADKTDLVVMTLPAFVH